MRTNCGAAMSGKETLGNMFVGIGIAVLCLACFLSLLLVYARASETSPDLSLGDKDKQQVEGRLKADFRQRPPEMIIEGGRLLGPLKEIIEEAVGISGYTIEWRVAPFKESLRGLRTGQVDIVPRTIRNEEREEFINFLGPIKEQKKDIVFMVPKGKEESIRAYEDLYNLSVGVKAKTAYFPKFDKNTSINKISTQGEDFDLAQMLIDGRINAIAVLDKTPIEMAMKELNHSDYAYALFRYEQTIGNYYGMSQTSKYAALYPKLNKTLLEMAASGRISQIYSKHEALAKIPSQIRILLTDTEKTWLSKHKDFRLGIDPARPPFEFFDSEGNYSGIGSSYVKAVEERLGITMEPLQGLSWSQVMSKAKAGEVDILPALVRTKARETYLNFTKSYISLPMIIASRKDTPYLDSLSDLAGLKVGVVKDHMTVGLLNQDYPNLKVVLHETLAQGLEELNAGRIDVFIDNLGAITYEMDRRNLSNIKIAAPTEYNLELSMAVRKDWPEMVEILNKAFDSISDQERAAIKNSWMALEVKIGFDLKTILVWAIPIGGSVVLIILFVVVWNRRLGIEIAERKRTEMQLERAEERSRLLLESAGEGIFGVGTDGLVNFINSAGLAMLGFKAEEVIGQKIHPLIHHTRPDGTPYPSEECPMDQSLTRGTVGNQDDEVLWRKDGTSFPAEYTSVPIRKNGSIAGTVVVFRDISERKEAEQALRESRATARGLLDATQESLLLLDKEGIIIAVNETAARRHQMTPEEMTGTNHFDLLPQKLRESRRLHFNNVLQTGNPEGFEDIRDGMVFHHIYYPVQDKTGSIIGVAIFAQDITERKHMEDELRQNVEELEQFSKLAIGREIKMIQLKKEINELHGQLGQDEKYEIVE
jgi:PAS domain S-box-containing protein